MVSFRSSVCRENNFEGVGREDLRKPGVGGGEEKEGEDAVLTEEDEDEETTEVVEEVDEEEKGSVSRFKRRCFAGILFS